MLDGPSHGATHRSAPTRYRWVALSVVLSVTFMSALDSTIVNIALPQIGSDLDAVSSVDWVVTSYLLSVGVSVMATGWLADRFGKKSVFVWSAACFAFASLLCALAPNLWFLVGARVLQGVGGGTLMPIGMAMIYELFEPHERGMAIGLWGVSGSVAPAIGPVVGGFIVTAVDWRIIFLVNVPFGLVVVPAAAYLLRDVGTRHPRPLDATALLLSASGLVLVLLALSEASTWGWLSTKFVATLGVGLVLVVLWVVRSLRSDAPLIDLRIMANPTFRLSMGIVGVLVVGQFARIVFIPLEFETVRKASAFSVGLMLAPAAVAMGLMMPISGRIADRIGARVPVVAGFSLMAFTFWMLGHLDIDTPMWLVGTWLTFGGVGISLAYLPATVIALNSVRTSHVAQASAVQALSRQVVASLGTAILVSVLASRVGDIGHHARTPPAEVISGYNFVFVLVSLLIVVGALFALRLPGKATARALQEERRRDSLTVGEVAPG
jgi:EmrB/QacA subfamily drug resistance transporter